MYQGHPTGGGNGLLSIPSVCTGQTGELHGAVRVITPCPMHIFGRFTVMLTPVLPPGTRCSFGVAIYWGRGRGIQGKHPYSSAFFPLCPPFLP